MPDNNQSDDLREVLNFGGLSDEEKITFLSEVGDVVLQSSLLRLVADLTEDQQEALQQFLETNPESEVLLKHLLEHHSTFETILEEEVLAFKAETTSVLSET